MGNTKYSQDGQQKIVLCGKGTHTTNNYLPGPRPGLTEEPSAEQCDRCIREGRQISEVKS